MKVIEINSPKYGKKEVMVDDVDYEDLSKYHWCIVKMPKTFYAVRYTCTNGKEKNVYMHRHIMREENKKLPIDHLDHNGINNQRSNLRRPINGQNQKNRQGQLGRSSKYVGVCWHKKDKKWQAAIAVNGKQTHLGQFDDEIEAATARDNAAKIHYGEYAHLNFKCQ